MHMPIFEGDTAKFVKIANLIEYGFPINSRGITKTIVDGTEKHRTGGEKLIWTADVLVEAGSFSSVVEMAYPARNDVRLGLAYRAPQYFHHVGKGEVIGIQEDNEISGSGPNAGISSGSEVAII